MELAYKQNWSEARERLLAYWDMQIIDRPCIAVTAPMRPARPIPPAADWQEYWTDPDYVAERYDAGYEATYFGGESLPGTSLMVGYCFGYGAPLHYSQQTVWQDPIIDSWEPEPSLELREDDWAWRRMLAVVQRCAEVSKGKWMTGWPNVHQPNDHLPLLRGTQRFLMDLIDHPTEVKRSLRKLLDNWYIMYERIADMLNHQEGSSGWLGLWCPWRRSVTLQSDVSCMLSPAQFEEFVAPELDELCDWLDGCNYHLDGPGALQHLPRLLSMPRIHSIQWTPGSGAESGLAWLELFRRIQEGGKGVVAFLAYDEVEVAVRELRPEGLFIITSAPSPDAADALLEKAVEITAQRRR